MRANKQSRASLPAVPYFKGVSVIIFLAIVVAILFLPVIIGWKGIFHDDQAMEEFPRYYFFARNLQRGIIPLWDPHTWCGAIPFYARYYANTYYVPLWPFFLLAPLDNLDQSYWSLIVVPLILHYLLAAGGMFLFLRRLLRCRHITACFGSLAYIYSPAFAYAYVWQQVVIVHAWLPWLLTLYISLLERWKLWKLVAGSTILAFIITGAAPSLWPFVVIIWGGIIVLQIIFYLSSGKKWVCFYKPILLAFMIVILGAGLSAVYLFSFFDGMKYTEEHLELTTEAALAEERGSLPPPFLATLFVPNLFDNLTGQNMNILNPSHDVAFWDANMSGGMSTSLLVFLGTLLLVSKRSVNHGSERNLRWCGLIFTILYIFAVLCILGRHTPFYRSVIGYLPGIGQLPRPVRYRFIQCFAVSILAAGGVECLANQALLKTTIPFRRWIWIYTFLSSFVLWGVVQYPFGPKEKISHEWSEKVVSSVGDHFPSGQSVGRYSDKYPVKTIRIKFDDTSSGEIRYADDRPLLPDQGFLAADYQVEREGWYHFDVEIPSHKFIWIYQKDGFARIGHKRSGIPSDVFVYDDIEKSWNLSSYSNAIWFIQRKQKPIIPLSARLKEKGSLGRLVSGSLLYWLLASITIIVALYYFSPKRFGYFLAVIAVLELFIFCVIAFYGNMFNSFENPRFVPHRVRTINPSEHPMVQRAVRLMDSEVVNSKLRIASDTPFHDNFVRLNNGFALMGYEMHPLEARFKRTIEAVYGISVGWPYYFENPQPRHTPFLSHFSVGYFMDKNPNKLFERERTIPLPEDSEFFIHTNPGVLPRIFTIDRVLFSSEEEQLNQLVSGDLRHAVYMTSAPGITSATLNEADDPIAHFTHLQNTNRIVQFNSDNPNQIEVDIDVSVAAMLVLTELWYPGWNAIVDSKPAEVYRVNYCQRGVWLDEGKHQVRFYFRPKMWQLGRNISYVTIALLLTVFAMTIVNDRRGVKNKTQLRS
jgi:hypothetical protein